MPGVSFPFDPPSTVWVQPNGSPTPEFWELMRKLWERTGGEQDGIFDLQVLAVGSVSEHGQGAEQIPALSAEQPGQPNYQPDLSSQNADTLRLQSRVAMLEAEVGRINATAELALNRAASILPVGSIIMWGVALGTVPVGWQIADGTNGTIDMVDLVPVGAGSMFSLDDTGGSDDPTTLQTELTAVGLSVTASAGGTGGGNKVETASLTNDPHYHDLDVALTDKYDLIPHRAVYFIQRIA